MNKNIRKRKTRNKIKAVKDKEKKRGNAFTTLEAAKLIQERSNKLFKNNREYKHYKKSLQLLKMLKLLSS